MKDGLMMALKEIVNNGKSLLLTLEFFFIFLLLVSQNLRIPNFLPLYTKGKAFDLFQFPVKFSLDRFHNFIEQLKIHAISLIRRYINFVGNLHRLIQESVLYTRIS